MQLPVLQFGAEEACGLGFCLLENIEDTTNQNSISEHDAREPGTFEHYEEHREMILAWRAITELREKPSEFQSKARSAINDFGSRVKNEGLEAALGFSLAKARPRSREDRKPEAAAHYWLLESLFREAQPPRPISTCHEWFNTPFSAREISRILSRWQWLRKFSEAILARRGQGNVEPEEVITNSD
ncbi:MAG: hypothetical protein D6732_05475 [Methanobacteriota archaeon]|nr:MAG: hypothetical protein D6732_05475 [Euryarchaeota archaeon]